jgi:lysozyme family protein
MQEELVQMHAKAEMVHKESGLLIVGINRLLADVNRAKMNGAMTLNPTPPTPISLVQMSRFEISADRVLSDVIEGGWSDHPKDPGGATMRGVTLAVARKHFGHDYTKDDLRSITHSDAKEIYYLGYWKVIKGNDLPKGIDFFVFDGAINSGPGQSVRWLQRSLGVADDGSLGPITLNAVYTWDDDASLIRRMKKRRMKFLRNLATWPDFGGGWTNRVNQVEEWALNDIVE